MGVVEEQASAARRIPEQRMNAERCLSLPSAPSVA